MFKKFFGLIIAIYLIILSSFFNNFLDENDWVNAGGVFLSALEKGSLQDTYVGTMSMHPGVTILWVSSFLQFFLRDLSLPNLLIAHRLVFLTLSFFLSVILVKMLLKFFKLRI